jgi:hypothetical protein
MTDGAPTGYSHRHDKGPRGMLARWWLAHRTKQVKKGLKKQRTQVRHEERQ